MIFIPKPGNCLFGIKCEFNCTDLRTYFGSRHPSGTCGDWLESPARAAHRQERTLSRMLSHSWLPCRVRPFGKTMFINHTDRVSQTLPELSCFLH